MLKSMLRIMHSKAMKHLISEKIKTNVTTSRVQSHQVETDAVKVKVFQCMRANTICYAKLWTINWQWENVLKQKNSLKSLFGVSWSKVKDSRRDSRQFYIHLNCMCILQTKRLASIIMVQNTSHIYCLNR